jgi:hypothetical protein
MARSSCTNPDFRGAVKLVVEATDTLHPHRGHARGFRDGGDTATRRQGVDGAQRSGRSTMRIGEEILHFASGSVV